jgi:hypothetical protein
VCWLQQAAAPDVAAIQAQVAASVRSVLGGDVSSDSPLMESGLDSLGASDAYQLLICAKSTWLGLVFVVLKDHYNTFNVELNDELNVER